MIRKVTHVRRGESRITHLKVNGRSETRDSCISEIENGAYYETLPPKGEGAKIEVIEKDDGGKYLRTVKDDTEKNNLGGLPTF
jgi:hypothetical protein